MTDAQLAVLKKYGVEVQIAKVIEELGELINAYLTSTDFDGELADVSIMLDTLNYLFNDSMTGLDDVTRDAAQFNTQYSIAVEAAKLISLLAETWTKKNKSSRELILCIARMGYRVAAMMTPAIGKIREEKLNRLADRVASDTVM